VAKPGVVQLARLSGASILCFHIVPRSSWVFRKSWDKTEFPKPFTRIAVSWARWTHVPADLDLPESQFEQKREELNAAIERARLQALAHFGKAAE